MGQPMCFQAGKTGTYNGVARGTQAGVGQGCLFHGSEDVMLSLFLNDREETTRRTFRPEPTLVDASVRIYVAEHDSVELLALDAE